ncbi:enoyl-CoA hydratase [Phenylobacterium montanum]|uniref:Enoyl-CoA hydratase domain-containing protein 3, mitochondrial n=1 Tax=Phenylobacterium montanum TaxID=2823693 RepID=A0A975G283_9CAUL|nr:enoyl-CoA hydratase [Caulobacter sp. S6]QUD89434.1 enoyl-CoA hydratase [Caulobacter sp. S6]
MSDEPLVLAEDHGRVRRLVMNRPERRNPLSQAMIAALREALARAVEDEGVRVIVLAAAGPVYSAGHDFAEMYGHLADADRGLAFFRRLMGDCSALMQAIVTAPKPVIAAVRGVATAAGCQLVASCDLAIAEAGTRFATPGVNNGLFCSTPMVALSRAVPRKQAMEMLLMGEFVGAEQALAMGLVNRVVPAGELEATVMAMATHIATRSSQAIAYGKRLFQQQLDLDLAEAYARASEVMAINMLESDPAEGIAAFLEKRRPEWMDAS